MLFGSAIFIFTLFFFLQFFKMLQCFSFCFHVFICDWVVMNQNFFFLYQSMWEDTKSKSFVRFSLFHLLLNSSLKCETLKKKERKKRLVPLQIRSPLHCWTTFFFLRVFLYHRQPPEHIGVELGYVDTVWSFMCSPVQTPTSHDHMFYVCSPLHTLFYSYWIEIYYSSNTSTKKSPFGLYEKIIYWTCRPIIYNDTGSFYYFLHGYIRRRRHWVSFSFLLFFFYTS